MFENRILRIKSGQKREEVTEVWTKLQQKDFHNLYSLTNLIRSSVPMQNNLHLILAIYIQVSHSPRILEISEDNLGFSTVF
jgi:hypothetical protein